MNRRVTLASALWLAAGLACGPAAADPLKIGVAAAITGPGAESGKYIVQGVRLAVEEVNKAGGVLGRPIALVIEDDQSTNPGAILAFSKLSADPTIPAFIAPVRSTQVQAIGPDVAKAARPALIGGTDPQLTAAGNPWLFRFRPNDRYSARVIAEFGVKTLGRRKWALVHSSDAFGTSGMRNLAAALKEQGIEPLVVQAFPNNSQDFTAVALAVKQSGADVLGTYIPFETDQGIFARQLRQLGVSIDWVGSSTTASATALKLAGPALEGAYAASDFHRDANRAAKAYAEKYEAAYKAAPDFFSAWAYDAVNVLSRAINTAGSLDPDRIRAAILATKDLEGAEGTYTFDRNGDGLHGYNIVRNERGSVTFIKRVDFKD
ncbi:Leucine-, isoleucine-, valine-, threonine-, and alanine-binding protein [Methylobacterium crusticola]|uniref:Leucine-, isoleucine-, valine-, threonine-, and alanine-binding protein n=1 Tax=Methylobacterium crusticola TaxID=1697972 RepID=A0ABQ4QYL7_9HYPH|nr:ABC transporter substrate-binding protein [Methylobacterium crusticola]GJD49759.1 Leucine-, isoleucine-, valine-, threonine-, and alanine-binding protein [Methylobacterium crusticola]